MDGTDGETNGKSRSAIPSREPVDSPTLTSSFGVRNDPFNGRHRMHQGVDIPGPIGTPVYATADGVVERAEWAGGYGHLVELNHGNGMQTRYGHLSKIIAQPNERVRRGQLIGLMGSTGRSTGSHLHYEVRIAGAAVDPAPYIRTTNYELALRDARNAAMGGPEARTKTDNAE
jgi:murein DD-endopeptidase MepM/ murein hydrolase activator NlpD